MTPVVNIKTTSLDLDSNQTPTPGKFDIVSSDNKTGSKNSDHKRKSFIDLGVGSFTYSDKNSNFDYDLGNFEPVDTQ